MSKKHHLKATIFDKRGNVISTGENSYTKTHPYQFTLAKKIGRPNAIYIHAEVAALIKLSKKEKQKAHRIFIERYDANGNPVLAKPCKACQLALEEAGIKIIEHT